ncbi:MAG TPA: WD40 repeat domain-containing serine/threonine protein kinase [Verrucomicrobiae bacterium]|nr:WD40 repeat domain-containing serine/threonine protein kinase [Verrucomicrobiae bacterium]
MALTGQAVGELCANCLLKLALEPVADLPKATEELVCPGGEARRIRYFGDYELVEEIARGGMGVIYKARQVTLNRTVALKMILGGDFSSPALIERFQTEAEAAARLEHPNIVPIYETGTHEGQHYFSMRFLEGGTLTTAMARKKFNARQATELMAKVARAVHHAHQRGILHRDLKPGNILFDLSGEPNVSDFGLAKVLEHDSSLTLSGAIMGTPSYMAPEQAAGLTKQLSTAADVYSLGAILYELLTGQPPFRGSTPAEVMRQVIDLEPERLRLVNGTVDRDLETICLKCLEKNSGRRYGSAEALAEDLQRWLSHEPIQARRVTVPERVLKWARRKPVVAGLVVALHLVCFAGIIGVILQARRANLETENARAESTRAESELWNANLSQARALRIAGGSGARVHSSALLQKLIQRPSLTETQILDLREEAIAQLALVDVAPPTHWVPNTSGKGFAWNAALDRYAWDDRSNQVEVREFPSERMLASFSGPPQSVVRFTALSANNRFIAACFNAANEVRVWNLETREQVIRAMGIERIKFSPDSQTFLTVGAKGFTVHSLVENGRVRTLQPGRRGTEAEFSPDSKHIAVLRAGLRNEIEIWDAASGQTRGSFSADFSPHHVSWHPGGTRLALGGSRGRAELRDLVINEAGSFLASKPLPLIGHLGSVQHIEFAPDGSMLMTYSWDSSSIAWDLISGRPLFREHRVELGALNSAGNVIRVLRDRSESVANLTQRTGFRTVAWAGQPREAHGVWVSPDGRLGAVSYESIVSQVEGDCILFDLLRGGEIARFKGIWVAFSADNRTLFTFERFTANRIRQYDVSPEALAKRLPSWNDGSVFYQGGTKRSIHTGAMAADGSTLIVAATDEVLFLDTLGGKPTRSWAKSAYGVVLSGDGKWAATSFVRQPAALRAIGSGDAVFRAPNDGRIRFSEDSRWMATVDPTGVQMRPLNEPPFPPAYTIDFEKPGPLAFSPDNQMFAVVFDKTHVRLYETSTGRILATLSPQHLAPIRGGRALTFSPDGQWLLAAKDDGETVAWNIPVIRQELAKLGLDWKDRQ